MLFLTNKKYLFSTFQNISIRFLQNNIQSSNKSINSNDGSAYEYATLNYNQKLLVLEKKLELADKIRASAHKTVIKKTAKKINLLKICICDEKSDLITVGSVSTGLTTSTNSDVDIVFLLLDDESNNFIIDFKKKNFKYEFLGKMRKLITNDKELWNNKKDKLSIITRAVVPIIKLNFKDGTKFDIQFCTHHTLKNTNLLRYYTGSDSRYRKLFMYVKSLVSNLNLLDGEKGLLTSYQISILVAHFLQRPFKDQQPVLPIIPQVCFPFVSPNLPINKVIENLNKPVDVSRIQPFINPKPLASHLAIQFVDYFANFDFLTNAIYMDKIDPVKIIQDKSKPRLQLFDTYSEKSISRGEHALEAFSRSMKYVQNSIKEGYFIDSF